MGAADMEAVAIEPRYLPSAEEKSRREHRDEDDFGKVAHHEDGLLAARIFGEITGDEFGLGFGKVEGDALGLGHPGDHQEDERDRLKQDAPARDEAEPDAALMAADGLQVEGAVSHDDGENREAEGDFVGNHLRGGADAAEQGETVIGGPSAEGNAVNADADGSEDIERADVEIGRLQVDGIAADVQDIAHRSDGESDDYREESQERGEAVDEVIRAVGHEISLHEHFDGVGENGVDHAEVGQAEAFADTEEVRAIGADAILD